MMENDKIVSINDKKPMNVDDAVNINKEAGTAIKLVVERTENVPDVGQAANQAQLDMFHQQVIEKYFNLYRYSMGKNI